MFKYSKTPYVFHHWGFLQLAVIFFLTFGVYLAQKKPGKLVHQVKIDTLLDRKDTLY